MRWERDEELVVMRIMYLWWGEKGGRELKNNIFEFGLYFYKGL